MKYHRIREKLEFIPRWAWYGLSFFVGGPFGPIAVWLFFSWLDRSCDKENRSVSDSDSVSYEDVKARWEQAEENSEETEKAEEPEENSCEAFIREGEDALIRIRRANDQIPDPTLTAQIYSIENSCRQILNILRERPSILPQLRTFLRYYLPTTLKLLEARARLEREAYTPKAREMRSRIEEALGNIDTAFKNQLSALDEYRFLDLETDMDSLENMMRSDGLLDEEDPFSNQNKPHGTVSGGH